MLYREEDHESMENFLKQCDSQSMNPCFKGYEHFKFLWDNKYIESGFTSVRLMYSTGRSDEHYRVDDDGNLEGLELEYHGGKPGTHDPKKVTFRW